MGMLQQLEKWSATHHPRWLVFLRVALGLSLFLKGISFISNSISLELVLSESAIRFSDTWLVLFISWAHLTGGFLIIIGLLTRWASLLNIPILAGAVILVNVSKGIFSEGSEFGFSVVILVLLVLFFIEGGGPVSLDNYFKKHPK